MREEKEEKINGSVCLFAGTTEGRLLAKRLSGTAARTDIFVATEYGGEGFPEAKNIHVFCGRLDEGQIEERLLAGGYDLVLDATHPYAQVVSENIRRACEAAGTALLRVLREDGRTEERDSARNGQPEAEDRKAGVVSVGSVEEAVEFLKGTEGRILVTTGSKELGKFRELPDWQERIFARVLSLPQVVSECAEMGFYGAHLIAMQGPFSRELNVALLKSTGAKWLVTKESGKAGGFEEKEAAAAEAGAGLVVIGRPVESGVSLAEAIKRLEETFGGLAAVTGGTEAAAPRPAPTGELEAPGGRPASASGSAPALPSGTPESRRTVWLISAGPGNLRLLTGEARAALEVCQLIAGASRNVEQLASYKKDSLKEYRPEAILAYLRDHPEYEKIAVVLSGDTGFYSGAKNLLAAFKEVPELEVQVLPGISSMNYFFARLGKTWEDARLLSFHGREVDLVNEVRHYKKVFLLAGSRDSLREICRRLLEAGLGSAHITVGEDLSLPEERIFSGTPGELKDRDARSLSVMLVENPEAVPLHLPREGTMPGAAPMTQSRGALAVTSAPEVSGASNAMPLPLTHGLPDEAFLRDEVPMTKMEVRTVSISKLALTPEAVIYDIGAGTGSVSAECARLSGTIRVYAIERKPEAVKLLSANKERFGLSNMEIISGAAPEALKPLPAPTHVFIGGSGKKMGEIIRTVLEKNPQARFVVNVIMPESLAELMEILGREAVSNVELVQIFAARSKETRAGHLMMGQNPVWIVSFRGAAEN